MPALTSFLVGGGLILGGLGAYTSITASQKMAEAQKAEIAQQQQIEAQRKKQMDLEYKRQQMQILRNQQRARALSLTTATAQNAGLGSALPGAYGGISGQANNQSLAGSQNYEIGNNIFGLNAGISSSRMAYADAQASYGLGTGLSSLGGAMISNAGTLSNAANSAYSSVQHAMSFGTGPGSWTSQMGRKA